jgi:hypothetical protein
MHTFREINCLALWLLFLEPSVVVRHALPAKIGLLGPRGYPLMVGVSRPRRRRNPYSRRIYRCIPRSRRLQGCCLKPGLHRE